MFALQMFRIKNSSSDWVIWPAYRETSVNLTLVLLNSKTKAALGRRNPLYAAFIFRDAVNKYLQL